MDVVKYLSKRLKTCTSYSLTEIDKEFLADFGVEEFITTASRRIPQASTPGDEPQVPRSGTSKAGVKSRPPAKEAVGLTKETPSLRAGGGFIYKMLTRKKFRKWSVDKNSQKRVKEAIHINFSKNQPIQFTFPFGGYKLWRFPTTPEVDWAEFFTIAYYCQYLAPILQVYEPGVIFYFSSDDIIIERMDNIPKKDTEVYFNSFNVVLDAFRKYFPKNMKMEIRRVADLYNREEFETELEKRIRQIKKEQPLWSEEKKKSMIKTSKLNIKWDGVEDWTKLSEQEKQQKIEMGPIYHDAYCDLSKRRAFVRGENKVVIFSTPISNAIAVGTTKTSITKFWTGLGVLENWGDRFHDRILSFDQWKAVKNLKHRVVKINLIPLSNFKEIWVYPKKFDFC